MKFKNLRFERKWIPAFAGMTLLHCDMKGNSVGFRVEDFVRKRWDTMQGLFYLEEFFTDKQHIRHSGPPLPPGGSAESAPDVLI